ncbi:MAG: 3-hydroxyacyl-CoA dehydrogenase [Syntrophomonadaceae bacterium]|nr:3-hydroxyacyl-CoA dehydrogenase [Syntrophomonadaceae bacterium]
MKAEDIKNILIVGSGTMGKHIGLQCALFDCDVVFYDIEAELLEKARVHIGKIAARLVRQGFVTEEQAKKALESMSFTTDTSQACKGTALVSESVPESVALKQKVWKQLDEYLPADAILTTNTSTLLPSQFADASGRPDRFLAWHFHLPSFTANVVDVMPHAGTDPEVTQTLMEFSRRIQQTPIFIKNEFPHYVYNRMFTALLSAAEELVVNDVAGVYDVDRAWMTIMNVPLGPFGMMDSLGLDTTLHVTRESLNLDPENETLKKSVQFLQEKCDKGELGMKTGKGFYTYPNPEYASPDFIHRPKPIHKK